MIETATGLVLRARPLTETSLIIHWLTPDLGRLATVAKGGAAPNLRSAASWICFIWRTSVFIAAGAPNCTRWGR